MKIFFNRIPRDEPYGGGNQFLCKMVQLLSQEGHKVTFNLEEGIDIIFLMDPRPGDIGYSIQHVDLYKKHFPNVKIIHRINECDKRKGTNFIDDLLLESTKIADRVVFISQWLADYFHDKGFNKTHHVVYNGCDTSIFNPREEKILNSPVKLVTHHWSDNWLKGFDLYTKIDEHLESNSDFEFTYVGRYYRDYKPKATNVVLPLHGEALANELKSHDIYITASRWEPCGMHHLEGAASGLPVLYHSETGGIKESCVNHGEEFSNFDEFLTGLTKIKEDYQGYLDKIDYDNLSIEKCCKRYYEILLEMIR